MVLLLQHFLVLEKLKKVSWIVYKGIMKFIFPIQIHIFSKFKIFNLQHIFLRGIFSEVK